MLRIFCAVSMVVAIAMGMRPAKIEIQQMMMEHMARMTQQLLNKWKKTHNYFA
ncbi:hypothetical protein QWI38_18975 [Acinetobacter pittii]|uniref:hypothetical protein n=1 Tax=Acinetobacter pittii TaxID=48296 RepID=UPI0027406A48|nr:hypothetical protein [Acinetobacter pittii]MDP7815184.1 hypothetical protein [Acinetobacter pittii]